MDKDDVALQLDEDLRATILAVGVQRKWQERDSFAVMRKLHAVNVLNTTTMRRMLQSDNLNTALSSKGFKTLNYDTTNTFRTMLDVGRDKGALCGAIRRDNPPSPLPSEKLDLSVTESLMLSILESSMQFSREASLRASQIRPSAPTKQKPETTRPMPPPQRTPASRSLQSSKNSSVCKPLEPCLKRMSSEKSVPFAVRTATFAESQNLMLDMEAEHCPSKDNTEYDNDDDDDDDYDEVLDAPDGKLHSPTRRRSTQNVILPDYREISIIENEACWRVVEVPLSWLFFYQTTVFSSFSCGMRLQDTVDELRSGVTLPHTLPLMYALVMQGKVYGMGTRRLTCFHYVWGQSDPHKLIPVLMCGKRCVGDLANHEGMVMSILGGATLDGVPVLSVERQPVPSKKGSATLLRDEYNKGIAPVESEGGELMHPDYQRKKRKWEKG